MTAFTMENVFLWCFSSLICSISWDFQWVSFSILHNSVSELIAESGNEHLGLDEHLGLVQAKLGGVLDSSFLGVGQGVEGGGVQVCGDVPHLVRGSLVHLAEDARYLGPVVAVSLLLLLLQISEVGTDGFGCELLLVVLQEHALEGVPLGEVQEGKAPETFVPHVGVVSKEVSEHIDFSLIGSTLSSPGSFVEAVKVVWCREVALVRLAMEQGQGGGPVDAFVLGQVIELVLVDWRVVGSGVPLIFEVRFCNNPKLTTPVRILGLRRYRGICFSNRCHQFSEEARNEVDSSNSVK